MDELALKQKYVGKSLHEVTPLPAAVLDVAKLEVNCQRMLDATKRLGLLWRPHVKTHKTVELTRLQVGDNDNTPVNIVVSTVAEATKLVPLMEEYQSKGRPANILYSFPFHSAAIPGLASLSKALGSDGLTLMIDHPDQVKLLPSLLAAGAHPPRIFVKVDTGYHRAGVLPGTDHCRLTVEKVAQSAYAGHCVFHGLYSHASQSYNASDSASAMSFLADEFRGLQRVVKKLFSEGNIVLSVGATPTATTIQHLEDGYDNPAIKEMSALIEEMKSTGCALEVHAGVYPTLDLQQLATHARDDSLMTHSDVAITILAEVASLYPGRGRDGTTEALVTAGCLALGREPVQGGKYYPGWGIVAPWIGYEGHKVPGADFPRVYGGWQVGRISQEHGILTWVGDKKDEIPLTVGQKVRIWPNHACIAGAGFDYYLVTDSRNKGSEDQIVDVWARANGW
ncbi:putative serine dehydratase domain-containing protein [Coniochaeta sp. 2T2.1]|nr:putative serine dehydratase domain-containing protein [Coniochaeta sp. 2T2.1]